MIFRPELAEKILAGRKTETRRRRSTNPRSPWWEGGCAYKPGQIFAIQDGRGKPRIANGRIRSVRAGELVEVDDLAARREGFENLGAFIDGWEAINGPIRWREMVWVVRFELIRAPRAAERRARAAIVKAQG